MDGSPGCVNGRLPPCDVDVLDGPYRVPEHWPKREDGTEVACLECGSRFLVMTVEGLPGDDFQSTCLCRLRFIGDGHTEDEREAEEVAG